MILAHNKPASQWNRMKEPLRCLCDCNYLFFDKDNEKLLTRGKTYCSTKGAEKLGYQHVEERDKNFIFQPTQNSALHGSRTLI